MKEKRRMLIIMTVLMSISWAILGSAVAAPTIGTVTVTPENPAPQSNVTFSVDISEEDTTAVHLLYKECNAELCYQQKNITMTKGAEDTYETTINLDWDEATFITYHLEVNSSGVWTKTEYVNITLSSETPGDGNNTNGNGNESPGFELVVLTGVIALIVIVMRRKRS